MFYLIEVAIGDDNDQSISDLIIYATSQARALDAIARHFQQELMVDGFDHESVTVDGDSDRVYHLWYESIDPEYLESDQEFDAIPYHADYTITGTYQSLQDAREHRASYHGDLGAYGYDGALDVLQRVDGLESERA